MYDGAWLRLMKCFPRKEGYFLCILKINDLRKQLCVTILNVSHLIVKYNKKYQNKIKEMEHKIILR